MPKGVFELRSRNLTLDGNSTTMGQWSDALQETIREYACTPPWYRFGQNLSNVAILLF